MWDVPAHMRGSLPTGQYIQTMDASFAAGFLIHDPVEKFAQVLNDLDLSWVMDLVGALDIGDATSSWARQLSGFATTTKLAPLIMASAEKKRQDLLMELTAGAPVKDLVTIFNINKTDPRMIERVKEVIRSLGGASTLPWTGLHDPMGSTEAHQRF